MRTGHSPYRDIQNSPQVIIQIHKGILPTLGKSIVPSSELSEFLKKTLQRNPTDRPSAEDLLNNDNFVNREHFIKELKLKAENLEREKKNQEKEIKHLKEQVTYLNCEVKYTLVLVGIIGHGKSACGNTLLGSRVFHDWGSNILGTPNVCKGEAIIQQELFEVFDTPGILRFDMSDEESVVSAVENATEIMNRSKRGVTAFLFVYRCSDRYTPDNAQAIKMLIDIYGPNAINKYGIFLVTHGDYFDMDKKLTLNELCEQQNGALKDFLCRFNKRIVLMYNIRNHKKRERCRAKVFDIVRQLSQQQDPYTIEDFQKQAAFHKEQKLKLEIQLELLAKADKLIN